jgi:hypothetical protein
VGFWDVRLAALEARGEVFSDDEVRVLEEGGKVIHLHPLQTPDVETRDWCTYPDRNEIVVLPEILDISGSSEAPPAWVQSQWGKDRLAYPTLGHYMDVNFSWMGGRSSWTDVPRYVGQVSHEHPHAICDYSCEDYTAYAYWNCWPIITSHDEDLAKQIIHTGHTFLDKSLWWELEWLCRVAYDGEYSYEDPWLYTYHPKRMKRRDREAFEAVMDYSEGDNAEESIRLHADQFQNLLNARVIDLEVPGLEDLAHGEPLVWLPFGDLAADLEKCGYWEAADLYRFLLRRRNLSLALQPRITNYRGIVENEVQD